MNRIYLGFCTLVEQIKLPEDVTLELGEIVLDIFHYFTDKYTKFTLQFIDFSTSVHQSTKVLYFIFFILSYIYIYINIKYIYRYRYIYIYTVYIIVYAYILSSALFHVFDSHFLHAWLSLYILFECCWSTKDLTANDWFTVTAVHTTIKELGNE